MTAHRIVLECATDLSEVIPGGLDMTPLANDLDALFRALSSYKRRKLFDVMSRVEVLARLAWGTYPLLKRLSESVLVEQTQAGAAVKEACECLIRHYPVRQAVLWADGLPGGLIVAGTPSPPPSGDGVT